ncbi:MAG: hypothetical protein GVY27_07490 [Deinococcus-Thermus bacterium]|jgi:lipopolysaccharide export system protein LptA|nr:hypothetical protein [Deinococcota bacterium]
MTRPFRCFGPHRGTTAGLLAAALGVALTVVLGVPGPAAAQLSGLTGSDEPVEIEAIDSLEWFSEEMLYVARGDVVIRQGETTLTADTVTAAYRELEDGSTEIFRLTAEGNVVVTTPEQTVTGATGVYDVDRAVFVMAGGDLKLVTPTDTVTARDSLEYWENRNLAVARGDAKAVRGDDQVEADELTAEFADGPEGEQEMQRLGARGNVVITTPTEVARGSEGVYDVETGIATLSGDVRLNRDGNQLHGDFAEVDMETGVSRLMSEPDSDRPLRGLLVPQD